MKYLFTLSLVVMCLAAQCQDVVRVTFFLSSTCRVCQYYALPMRELYQEYGNEQIEFVGAFPGVLESDSTISKFRSKYLIPFELKKDSSEHIRLGATITPEVVVERNGHVVYLGRIDNSFESVGKKRSVVNSFELRNVLSEIINGRSPEYHTVPAIGCIIEK